MEQNHYDDVERYEIPSKICCDNPSPHTHTGTYDSVLPRRQNTHIYAQLPVTSKENDDQLSCHRRWLTVLSVVTLMSLLLALTSLAIMFGGSMATTPAEVVDTKPTDPEPEIRITTPTIAPTNVTEVTTGTPAIPIQCMEAINLTLAFRADNKGMNLRPKDGMHNCDTYNMIIAGRPWFRFQAPAGNRILDRCPPPQSCGTQGAMWSNVPGPDEVGSVQLINVFVSDDGGCRSARYNLGIIRCSQAEHDFIYRHEGDAICNRGYCATQ